MNSLFCCGLMLFITTLAKANVLKTEAADNGKKRIDYDLQNENQNIDNNVHKTETINGGFRPGLPIQPGANCGPFDSKDTTHLVSDPNHDGSFYFCVNGVSLGPMECAQGTVFHPIFKVCSWPELSRNPYDPPHIAG